MSDLNANLALEALRRTGAELALHGVATLIELVLMGSTAGLFAGALAANRVTSDCDVAWPRRDHPNWVMLSRAAEAVADALGLPREWLNYKAQVWSRYLPLGWRERCEEVGQFGPLVVQRISRVDLICTKIFGAPRRPQDLDDLLAIRPTLAELEFARAHLERVRSEDLSRGEYDDVEAVLDALERLA